MDGTNGTPAAPSMGSLAAALLLALASAAAYATAAVLQERVAAADRERPAGVLAALDRPAWWLAAGLNATGAALHVLALRYGPLALVQPLGAVTLVLALPLQAAVTRRRVPAMRWRGAALTLTGLAGVLLLVRGGGPIEALTPGQIRATVAVTAVALATLGTAAALARRRPVLRGLSYASAAGVAFAVASVLTQTVSVQPGLDPGTVLTALAVAALATAGLLLAQAAYRDGLGAPLATATLVNPVVAAGIGLTLLGEELAGGAAGAATAAAAALLAARGVALLARPHPKPPRWHRIHRIHHIRPAPACELAP